MKEDMQNVATSEAVAKRTEELFHEHQKHIYVSTDRWFAILMVAQWIGGIVAALVISPHTWIGERRQVHIHVWMAIFLGGAISAFPILLTLLCPGRTYTRHVVAVGQMLWSALLIHLTGGRIETHFHVFGSLAFLAFYRDWRVLIPATVVVAADHLIRGIYYPESVFGILTASPWRWLEHAGWVLFEDTFLIAACLRNVTEMRNVAERTALLEDTNQNIEKLVKARTAELESVHKRLLDVSRSAGMADVATSVLHNVGNVLNSINVSTNLVREKVAKSEISNLGRATKLMKTHETDLGAFLTQHSQGKQILPYLDLLDQSCQDDQKFLIQELESLTQYVNHIKTIIATQQSLTGVSSVAELVSLPDALEEAVHMGSSGFDKYGITIVRDYRVLDPVLVDKMKLTMILVNLLRNAKDAVVASNQAEKCLTLRTERTCVDHVGVHVIDNGTGIAPENLTRIFSWGFTTKPDGHGYGLHSSALAAKEMGGSLNAYSDGPGKGAKFSLELPVNQDEDESREK